MKGIIAGVCAGFAGAAVWALVAWLTEYEIGWIAWGIGAAVGAAVAWGSEGTPAMGVAAVVISVLAILGGKYLTVELLLANELDDVNAEVAQMMQDDEYYISWLGDAIVVKVEEAGGTVEWPEGVDIENATTEEEYPAEVWAQAEQAWLEMTPEKQDEFKTEVQNQVKENIAMYTNEVRKQGFLASFSLFDGLFFFLAIGTAYKIGSKADS